MKWPQDSPLRIYAAGDAIDAAVTQPATKHTAKAPAGIASFFGKKPAAKHTAETATDADTQQIRH